MSICIETGCFLKIGGGTYFSDDCQVAVMNNSKANIGEKVYFGKGCRIFVRENFDCGRNSLFADNVSVYDHNHIHHRNDIPISEQGFSSRSVNIGENCWLCTNVVVTKGSRIENNVVVAGRCKSGMVYKYTKEHKTDDC